MSNTCLVCLQVLLDLYDKILRTVARMPQDAVYRTSTESIVKDRLAIVRAVSKTNYVLFFITSCRIQLI